MKFNCGLTRQEKNVKKWEERKAKGEYLKDWHPYFAFLPIRIGSGDCRWLETIERRGYYLGSVYYDDGSWDWEYRVQEKPTKIGPEPRG